MAAGLYFGYKVTEMALQKAEEKTKDTELTKGERAGYTLSPVIQSTVDLVQGDSLKEVGDKFLKTHVDNTNAVIDKAKELGKDALDGPVPKWALPFTGGLINILVD